MFSIDRVVDDLVKDEGFSGVPYLDTRDKLTIGYGRNLDDCPLTDEEMNYLGMGRTFDDEGVPLSEAEGKYLLKRGIRTAIEDARAFVPAFNELPNEAQEVLLNMAYNMGRTTLMKFRRLRGALMLMPPDFKEAKAQILDSAYARGDTKKRAKRLATRMGKAKC